MMKITANRKAIRLLQRALNALNRGHGPCLALDGEPGPRTAAACRFLLSRRDPAALLRAIATLA